MNTNSKPSTGLAVTLLLLAIPNAFLAGWVFSVLWDWFVMPVFAVPSMNVWQGTGLMFMVNFVKYRVTDADDGKPVTTERIVKSIVVAVVFPVSTLALGWLLYVLMHGLAQ